MTTKVVEVSQQIVQNESTQEVATVHLSLGGLGLLSATRVRQAAYQGQLGRQSVDGQTEASLGGREDPGCIAYHRRARIHAERSDCCTSTGRGKCQHGKLCRTVSALSRTQFDGQVSRARTDSLALAKPTLCLHRTVSGSVELPEPHRAGLVPGAPHPASSSSTPSLITPVHWIPLATIAQCVPEQVCWADVDLPSRARVPEFAVKLVIASLSI